LLNPREPDWPWHFRHILKTAERGRVANTARDLASLRARKRYASSAGDLIDF
jgi:hypothetical protein